MTRSGRLIGLAVSVVFGIACGASRAGPTSSPTDRASAEPIVPEVAEAPIVALPPRAPVHVEVVPPADLRAALGALRPTIELVPAGCPRPTSGHVAVGGERVCWLDDTGTLCRASRRVSLSFEPSVTAVEHDGDVVFVVADDDEIRTRFHGHLWRWDLAEDRVSPLGAVDGPSYVEPTDFGAVVIAPGRTWVLERGVLGEVTGVAPRGLVATSAGTFVARRSGGELVIERLRRDEGAIAMEEVARLAAERWELVVAFPDGAPLVVSVTGDEVESILHVWEPPGAVRELVVRPGSRVERAAWVNGGLELETLRGVVRVDLRTSELTPAPPWPPAAAPITVAGPRSVHALFVSDDGVALGLSGRSVVLGADGALLVDELAELRSRCRCRGEDLRCGREVTEGACVALELEVLTAPGRAGSLEHPPSSVYSSRFRVDRIEADFIRITRLSDGARLWLRVLGDALVAQADDGAFMVTGSLDLDGWSVLWGRSLREAPVTALSPARDRLERPGLVQDFFADRPLPAADTTVPPT